MKISTITGPDGRKYQAITDDGDDKAIVIGPPEGLVDEFGLPEPFATRLHNILHARGLLSYEDVRKNPKAITGALQEFFTLDSQRLTEMFFKIEQEDHHE